jgi:thiol-disulfide isomerase/thioredoxin
MMHRSIAGYLIQNYVNNIFVKVKCNVNHISLIISFLIFCKVFGPFTYCDTRFGHNIEQIWRYFCSIFYTFLRFWIYTFHGCVLQFSGLYFSAHWCPPCRGFTPVLKKLYETKSDEDGKKLQIVFISSDRDENSFNEYFGEMPWIALKYNDRDGKVYLLTH